MAKKEDEEVDKLEELKATIPDKEAVFAKDECASILFTSVWCRAIRFGIVIVKTTIV